MKSLITKRLKRSIGPIEIFAIKAVEKQRKLFLFIYLFISNLYTGLPIQSKTGLP